MDHRLIYLDNAATTFPKPGEVLKRTLERYQRLCVSPGRGGYDLAVEAGILVEETRQKLARFFGAPDPDRVIFASNATDALNLAIQGILGPGDHVVATRLEHNSVLRPLFHLKKQIGIDFDLVPFDQRGFIDPEAIGRAIRPHTRLVVVCHASNVLGTVQPAADIAQVCADRGVPLLLDVAQSAGLVPIDMQAWGVQAVAFTGHKALMGPSGIGGLVLLPELQIAPTRFGGTGIDSANLFHTESYPHRLEAGTLNLMGIIGLSAGLDYVEKTGMDQTLHQEITLLERLWQGLRGLDGVTVYTSAPGRQHTPVLLCNIDGMRSEDVGAVLDGDYGIAVRAGLHCAPLVHQDLGTGSLGAVRFSLGPFNTADEIDEVLEAMAAISRAKKKT
jgi:cysteine desulfurase / selenocysteine lyase